MRLPKYGFINDINKKLSVSFKDILVLGHKGKSIFLAIFILRVYSG